MNKEIDNYSTDPNLIKEIDKDCLEIIRDFSGDPDLELFKIKYETLYNSLKESYDNEVRWIKKYFLFEFTFFCLLSFFKRIKFPIIDAKKITAR